jgi:hypothetical protein
MFRYTSLLQTLRYCIIRRLLLQGLLSIAAARLVLGIVGVHLVGVIAEIRTGACTLIPLRMSLVLGIVRVALVSMIVVVAVVVIRSLSTST